MISANWRAPKRQKRQAIMICGGENWNVPLCVEMSLGPLFASTLVVDTVPPALHTPPSVLLPRLEIIQCIHIRQKIVYVYLKNRIIQ
jgi:hypothetical protein